jgi:hypothetical protein
MGKKRGKRMGRPPIAPEHKRSRRLAVRVTERERRTLEAEARKVGLTLTALLRARILGKP